MSKIIRVFACLFTLFFVGSAYAAGYTCDSLKKYTSCTSGYYLSDCGASSNWTGQTISSPAVGNSCIKGTDTSYTYSGGAVCPKKSTVKCAAGKYLPANKSSESDCTTCPNGSYCVGGDFTPNYASNQGIATCPAASTTTVAASSSYPDSFYPYTSTSGSVDKTTTPTRTTYSMQTWGTGWATINDCKTIYVFANAGGVFNADGVKYNSSTGKYDNFSGADIYYSRAYAGYYLYTKYNDTYCNTGTNRMLYRKVVYCPAGSYCVGGAVPQCSTGTHNNEWGRTTCPGTTATSTVSTWHSAFTSSGESTRATQVGDCLAHNMSFTNVNGGTGTRRCFYTSGSGSTATYSTGCHYYTYTSCNAGYYMTYNGAANSTSQINNACTACSAGTYKSAAGTGACTACAIGSYSSAGATGCTACTGGKTTTATGQSSCTATCTNATGASTWTTPTWSANTVTNKCAISACSTGYTRGGTASSTATSSYTCSANCNTVTLNATTNGGTANTTVYKRTDSTTWYSNNTCSTSITSITKPTKTNATYAGHYNTSANSGGTQCVTAAGALSTSTTCNVTGTTTFYARYNCNTGYTASGTTIAGTCAASCIAVTLNNTQNGGTGGTTTLYKRVGSTTIYSDSACSTALTLVKPTKTNATYAGHYNTTALSGGTQCVTSSGTWYSGFNPTSAATCYARYTCNTGYTASGTTIAGTCDATCNAITFNATQNGGSGTATTLYKKSGSTTWYSNNTCSTTITTLSSRPTKTNATYAGHYNTTAASGGTQCVTAAGTLSTSTACNVTGATTFYPQFTCNTGWTAAGTSIAGTCTATTNTITLNKNGGTGTCGGQSSTTSGSLTCTTSSSTTLPSWDSTSCNITNGNKVFKGWSTSTTATSGVTSITCPTASATYYAAWATPTCSATNGSCTITTSSGNAPRATITCNTGYSQSGGTNRTTSFTVTGTAGATSVSGTCYAMTSTVSFNLNEGTGNLPNNVTATYGSNMPALSTSANPSRTGYTFGGWYDTSASTGGTQYYNTSRGSARTWDKTDASVTLYARWTINTYTCAAKYYLNGTTCTLCEAGYYCPAESKTYTYNGAVQGRTYCAAGTYNSGTGNTSCTTCPAGNYCTGGTNKTSCAAGTYRSGTGGKATSDCISCVTGSYSAAGASACTACGDGANWGMTTTGAGQTSCNKECGTVGVKGYVNAKWNTDNTITGLCLPSSCETDYYLDATRDSANNITASSCKLCSSFANGLYPHSASSGTSSGREACFVRRNELPGQYIAAVNAETATDCPAGTYNGTSDETAVHYGEKFSCTTCAADTYAAGTGNSSCTACLENYHTFGEKTSEAACRISCPGGSYLATARATKCSNVGAGYWAASSYVLQGSTGTRNACATGLTTIGYGTGADEADDCGRVLHVGTSKLYLRSAKKTTPSLSVQIGGKTYYGNMSTEAKNMSNGASQSLKLNYNNTSYSVFDDSGEFYSDSTGGGVSLSPSLEASTIVPASYAVAAGEDSWSATLSNGTKLTGIAACSATTGTNGDISAAGFTPESAGTGCWCKLSTPAAGSKWIYATANTACTDKCGFYCANNMKGTSAKNIAWRTNLYQSAGITIE